MSATNGVELANGTVHISFSHHWILLYAADA